MSYCYFYGIVPVSEGRRVQSIRANGGTAWHMVYDTMFVTESGNDIDGTLRAFAPASASILQSNTLTIVHGKFTIPPTGKDGKMPEYTIEAISNQPFLADPTREDFDSFLPEDTMPFFSLLGTVVGSVVQMADNGKAIDIRVSSYIQNKIVDCMIRCRVFSLINSWLNIRRCRFPPNPRWARVNIPIAGSVIAIIGRPHSITGSADSWLLILTIEDIVYNPGAPHILADPKKEASSSPRRLQIKKRKRTDGKSYI